MQLLDIQTLAPAPEQRIVLNHVTWEQYESISSLFVDEFPRMTYLEGKLEIVMTVSPEHERLKTIIARLIETYAVEKRINLNGYGNTTFRNQAVARGAEPDECYCLGELGQVPDIVLEIALTSGGVDKLKVYQGLRVPEVWFWQNGSFSLYRLGAKNYAIIPRSTFLPDLDFSLLSQYLEYANQTEAVLAYREALQNY